MSQGKGDDIIRCSFCTRDLQEVLSAFAGAAGVYICDYCIRDANEEIVRTNKENASSLRPRPKAAVKKRKPLLPMQIKAGLDEYVIGQERAKKALSVAVYNHYKRVEAADKVDFYNEFGDVELEKANILLLGSSGTGKTLLARTLARILHVPFSISDATALTEAGYVGDDVETILSNLLSASDFDVKKAERGIIYIDEIDKIARKSDHASITRDVSGEGVQQALLKVLEGTEAGVPPRGGRKHPEQSLITIDTRNILFICGGAFAGLPEIIAQRVGSGQIGFVSDSNKRVDKDDDTILQYLEPDDLLKFGLIPEFIGRLNVMSSLDPLSDEIMMAILTQPKNAIIRQYQKLFAMDSINLVFDQEALKAIVDRAREYGTGARGLRSIMESSMIDIMYEVHSLKDIGYCRITRDTILHGAKPVYEQRRASA
ncbi:MAG: ATP-dependent Clp protease ATP-binding subunit ClpX [Bacteroidota bacterium]|nr:ATP-dependent Clp protease ATP-binding subunit ClpX [Bacteroidota bacterium]MDE2833594.1 ATP-dependent Clp protease ATP-binding subunit ClpX [Bacteroidota bacterium]MDE2958199.1 ATP-dependent Clp protease ATP-binding subunit ClpX [Bacteroidota bacterium]